jgi:beta-glucosidase
MFLASVINPWQNPALPIEQRLDDLMPRLSQAELLQQLMLGSAPVNRTGLQLPGYSYGQECLAGVSGYPVSSAFPLSINLGSTFDTDLVAKVATAISDEARAYYNARHVHSGFETVGISATCLAPQLNVARDARWGRSYETFSEDPHVIATMGVAYIKAMQGDKAPHLKVMAAPKHIGAYSLDCYNPSGGPAQYPHCPIYR